MLLLASHEDNKYNDCLTSMHTSKGAGVKDWIKDVKHSATDDPATSRAGYMQRSLKKLFMKSWRQC